MLKLRGPLHYLVRSLVWIASHLYAQQTGSEVLGAVVDPTASAVSNASVSVRQEDTGIENITSTDARGAYRLSLPASGLYSITVSKAGFKTDVRSRFAVRLNQRVVIDIELSLGDVSERVEIEGRPELIETSSAQTSRVVDGASLRELPLNGRDIFQLVLLQPNVVPALNSGSMPFTSGGRSKASAQGARPMMNNVTLDGVDVNEPGFNVSPGGIAGLQLGVESVSEFRVILGTPSAEYGRNAGATVQYVTRSGTNQLHGSLYEFHRNAALDARNFFDPSPIPPLTRNQFGATIGGPIRRNQTFYFLNYESLRESRGIVSLTTVPDDNARLGLLPSASNPSQLVNVGIAPSVLPFLALFPRANGTQLGGGTALLRSAERQKAVEHYGVARIDQYVGARDLFWLRSVEDAGEGTAPYLSSATPGFPARRGNRNHYALLGWNHTLSAASTNTLLLHLNRTAVDASTANEYPLSVSLVPGRALGTISVSGLSSVGNFFNYPMTSISNTYELLDNYSVQIGRHTVRIGIDAKRMQINGRFDLLIDGQYSFSDLTGFGVTSLSGNPAFEAFLHAQPFLYLGVNPRNADSTRGYRQTNVGAYAQDDWRVNSKLTLNLGLRWDYSSNPSEANNRLVNIRNIATDAGPTLGKIWESVPLNLWSPRVGLAWRPAAKTSIRAGVALLRDQIWANPYSLTRFSEPFYSPVLYILPSFQTAGKGASIADPAGLGGPPSTLDFASTYRPKFPYLMRATFDVQREIWRGWVAEAGYTNSRGRHLMRSGEANYLPNGAAINPKLGSLAVVETDGTSDYNALALRLEGRVKSSLQMQASYTWSKSQDDASGILFTDWATEQGVSQNFFDRRAERGRSAFDRGQVLVANMIYQSPNKGPVLRDWRLSGIGTAMSNVPFTANLGGFSNSGSFTASSAERPDVSVGSNPCGSVTGDPNRWFDAKGFRLPAPGQYGNAGRNILCGPSLFNIDVALTREFKLSERSVLGLRLEAFNILNHTNFDAPSNTPGSTGTGANGEAIFVGRKGGCDPLSDAYGCGILAPNLGRIFKTATSSRQIQIGLKLSF